MSDELTNVNSSKASVGSYALMPSIYVGVNAINNVRHFGAKNAFNPLGESASELRKLLKGDIKKDFFQSSQFASETFEATRSANIAAKKAEKLASGKLPLKEKFFNLFRKNKIKGEDLIKKKGLEKAKDNLSDINTSIKNSNKANLQENLKKIDTGYANSLNFIHFKNNGFFKSFGTQAWDNFKKEFSFAKGNRFNAGFNVAMTAIQFIPNVINKVAPAFKNNGFKAGMTELGQTIVQAGADLVSYAAGGAIGRTIGSALGALITPLNPIGAWIGGLVGDMVGSMFVGSKVCDAVEKVVSKDDEKNTGISKKEQEAQKQFSLDA